MKFGIDQTVRREETLISKTRIVRVVPSAQHALFHIQNIVCMQLMLWSHIISGTVRRLLHQKSYDSMAPIRHPAGGMKNRTMFYQFLDIVQCPVKFRYNLKFHGARTAFGRANEGKMTSAGHRCGFYHNHCQSQPQYFLF